MYSGENINFNSSGITVNGSVKAKGEINGGPPQSGNTIQGDVTENDSKKYTMPDYTSYASKV